MVQFDIGEHSGTWRDVNRRECKLCNKVSRLYIYSKVTKRSTAYIQHIFTALDCHITFPGKAIS